MTDPVIVLSGGGNLGAVQAGMLQTLLHAGVRPRALLGSSVGALNAAHLAVDPTAERADGLVDAWRAVRGADVFAGDGRLGAALLAVGRRPHLHDARGLRRLIGRWFEPADLADTAVPLHVATTELASGIVRWWRAGDPTPVLLATAAIPVLFPPVELDGTLHVDGALVEPIGLRRAAALGTGPVIAIDTGATALPFRGADRPVASLVATIRAGRMARLAEDRAAIDGDRVHWLTADCPDLGYRDFTRSEELIALGRDAAERMLADQPGLLPQRSTCTIRSTGGRSAGLKSVPLV
mgnify:CR=1 FL=1